MTKHTDPRPDTFHRLIWPLRLTRLGLMAERGARAFWPLWSVLFLGVASFAFGLHLLISGAALWVVIGLWAAAVLWAALRGLRMFRVPTHGEAVERLDATMPGRPILALLDEPAIGADDPAAQSVWAAHVRRMAQRAAAAQAPEPDLRLSGNDPYALRYVAAVALAMALLFGSFGRVSEMGESVALGAGPAGASGPSWEGWVEPPLYTGLPSLYLNDILADEFGAPSGSRITLRTYGEPGSITMETDVGDLPDEVDPNAFAQHVTLERSGSLTVNGAGGRTWEIRMLLDTAPSVALEGEVEGEPPGGMQFTYSATDDYGVVSGSASISLDLDNADRRYGLALPPEPREALVLDLPLPFRGSRAEFSEVLIEDVSEHPFANLPVIMVLTVTDAAGQIGTVSYDVPRLPGRRFFDPLANALVEMRRDILWTRENAPRAAQLLRALTAAPEEGLDESVYLLIRSAIRRLESGVDSISAETRDEVADMLWAAALELEVGDLDDALERLQRAQERLAEAIQQGASEEEIAELMQELRDAMNDYMRQLAENAQPGEDQPDQSGERTEMSMADIEEMMRRIEELMQEGRIAEAMEMLEALQQMLENMEVTQGEGGDGPQTPGQEAMEGLQDTLRDQQELSDDAFRELQEQFNGDRPGQQSQQGQRPGEQPGQGQANQGQAQNGQQPGEQGDQPGQDGSNPGQGQGGEGNGTGQDGGDMTLAERQEALRRQLEDQARRLPGAGTDAGDEALRRLDEAGRAMEGAEEALEGGDIADALDLQSEALEALREGMSELGRALAQERGEDPGQGMADGNMAPDQPLQDPLGRQAGNSGALGSEADMEAREEASRRARELVDELRRRSSEQERPEIERDYLRRLLDQF